ncbi:MAG: hypothetical protein MZV65_14590 [Chromatiales bacterium]|nr:hypothetical protein [Chromatiales bacterium]
MSTRNTRKNRRNATLRRRRPNGASASRRNYEHPVPSREAILAHLAQRGEHAVAPVSSAECAGRRTASATSRPSAAGCAAMERDGQLLREPPRPVRA